LGSVPVRTCSLPQYNYVLVLVNDYFQYDYVLIHVYLVILLGIGGR
jgi:hypothetical protein